MKSTSLECSTRRLNLSGAVFPETVISTTARVHVKVTFESAGRREKQATIRNLV